MQGFLVKYAHKYAQKLTKICKNGLKYALNMQELFSIKCRHFRQNIFFLLILKVIISFTQQIFRYYSK